MSDDLCKECSKRLEIRRNKKGSAYVACGNVACKKYKPTEASAPAPGAEKVKAPIAPPQPDQPRKRGFFALT